MAQRRRARIRRTVTRSSVARWMPREHGVSGMLASGMCLAATACGSTGAADRADAFLAPVIVVEARHTEDAHAQRYFSGTVRARHAPTLAFEAGGEVRSVSVRQGDRVKPGQVLARLDTRMLRAERRRVAAQLRSAQAERNETQGLARRVAELASERFASEQRAESATQAAAAAEARVAALRATLQSLDVRLDQAALRARNAGVITARHIDPGEVLAPGVPAFDVRGESGLEAVVRLPAREAKQLDSALDYQLTYGNEGDDARSLDREASDTATRTARHVFGRLAGLSTDVSAGTQSVEVVFRLEGPETALTPGQTVSLKVAAPLNAQGYWLPLDALRQGPRGLWEALRVMEDAQGQVLGTVALRINHAETSPYVEPRVLVDGTLAEGDLIVARGVHRLTPGQRVRVLDATDAADATNSGGAY